MSHDFIDGHRRQAEQFYDGRPFRSIHVCLTGFGNRCDFLIVPQFLLMRYRFCPIVEMANQLQYILNRLDQSGSIADQRVAAS